jgi:D-alanyl-D-alanine carboxypeptidase
MCAPLLVIFGFYFYSNFNAKVNNESQLAVVLETKSPRASTSGIKSIRNPFENISVTAKAAIVKDINSGEIIYSKNPDAPLPLASINKIMTALVASTNTDPNQQVVIDQWALMKDGEDFFSLGERFKLKDLLEFTLVKSSNDGAAAIASAVQISHPGTNFIQQMNQLATNIGMTNTYFLNETGLDQNLTTAGSFGSSRDVATMMEFAIKNYPEILEATKEISISKRSENGIIHEATNTNDIIPELNNLIASKTGFTDLAGGNLAVIVDPALNKPVVIVVLGSTFEGRFNDVLKLANSLQEYFNYQDNN